jgi:hypothetical protein
MSSHLTNIVYFYIFQSILAAISHNVPAVYDGLAARIRALRRHLCMAFMPKHHFRRKRDQGCKNVAELGAGFRFWYK